MNKNNIFNIQLFADLNTNTTSDTGLAPEVKDYYDTECLRNAKPNLVYAQFGKKTGLPQGNGHIVKWRRMIPYGAATTPLQEGITPAGKKAKFEEISVEAKQYGDYTVISDRVKMETLDPIVIELTREHGNQGALTIDTVTRNELMCGTTVVFPDKKTTDEDGNETYTKVTSRDALDESCTLNSKLVGLCKTILKRRNAPKINGSYVAIIHPDCENDLMNDPNWIDVVKYKNPEQIFEGEIGKLNGVRFVTTSEAMIWNDSKAEQGATPEGLAVYGCIFLGADAFGNVQLEGGNMEIIVKPLGSGGTEDPLNQRSSVGWKVTDYATKILDETRIVRAEVCSAEFSKLLAA